MAKNAFPYPSAAGCRSVTYPSDAAPLYRARAAGAALLGVWLASRVPARNAFSASTKCFFAMFVPNLSWETDRFQSKHGSKTAFSHRLADRLTVYIGRRLNSAAWAGGEAGALERSPTETLMLSACHVFVPSLSWQMIVSTINLPL